MMIMNLRKRMRSQKGFTLIELMVVIAILGILAAIAIPRFANSTTAANTAKIAADLRTIDSAISMYQAQNGSDPTAIGATGSTTATDLVGAGFLAARPAPPTSGQYYLQGVATNIIAAGSYNFTGTGAAMQGTYGGSTADLIHR